MYVCVCKAVSDRTVRQLAQGEVLSLRDVTRRTGAGSSCGKCVPELRALVVGVGVETQGPALPVPACTEVLA